VLVRTAATLDFSSGVSSRHNRPCQWRRLPCPQRWRERCDLLRCVRAHVIAFDTAQDGERSLRLQAGDAESMTRTFGPNRTGGGRDLGNTRVRLRSPKFDGVVSRQCRLAR